MIEPANADEPKEHRDISVATGLIADKPVAAAALALPEPRLVAQTTRLSPEGRQKAGKKMEMTFSIAAQYGRSLICVAARATVQELLNCEDQLAPALL